LDDGLATQDGALHQFYQTEFLLELDPNGQSNSQWLTTQANALIPKSSGSFYLQHHYIATNPHPSQARDLLFKADQDFSSYGPVHARYHEYFQRYAKKFSYYDIFLVDSKSGNIVYSVFKESDFGTSLLTGPYRNANIAQAFKLASNPSSPDATYFVDYQPYLPSQNAPAAFFASPIFQGDEQLGVLIFQIPVDQINNVMTGDQQWAEHGLGASGETYLVGSDFSLRSASRFFIENPDNYLQTLAELNYPKQKLIQLERFGTSILTQEVNTDSVLFALQGSSGAHVIDDYREVPVLSSYGPVTIGDQRWAVIAEIDAAEAFAPVTALKLTISLSTVAIGLVIVGLGIWVSRSLTQPISALTAAALEVGKGVVIEPLDQTSNDELGELTAQFNQMAHNLHQQRLTIDKQTSENYQLLLNVLPEPIANRLKNGEVQIADAFPSVSVLFADIVGFTAMSRGEPPIAILRMLDELFGAFDQAAIDNGVEKIKTIGDSYMAVCGMPEPNSHHADQIAALALAILKCLVEFNERNGTKLSMRIGAHSGAVVAGVVGTSKYIYDLWGDTVNMASRMESTGIPDHFQVSEDFKNELSEPFEIAFRGELQVKGIGPVNTYLISALSPPE
jgi:class 3 adenylate cyclase